MFEDANPNEQNSTGLPDRRILHTIQIGSNLGHDLLPKQTGACFSDLGWTDLVAAFLAAWMRALVNAGPETSLVERSISTMGQ